MHWNMRFPHEFCANMPILVIKSPPWPSFGWLNCTHFSSPTRLSRDHALDALKIQTKKRKPSQPGHSLQYAWAAERETEVEFLLVSVTVHTWQVLALKGRRNCQIDLSGYGSVGRVAPSVRDLWCFCELLAFISFLFACRRNSSIKL